jgi:hypothetical protein
MLTVEMARETHLAVVDADDTANHLGGPRESGGNIFGAEGFAGQNFLRGGTFCGAGLFAGRDLSLRGRKCRAAQNKLTPSNHLFSGRNSIFRGRE